MSSGESVIRMRDAGDGSDLDIFLRGLVRDIMRLAGAASHQLSFLVRDGEERE